jgi:hypothetical protein
MGILELMLLLKIAHLRQRTWCQMLCSGRHHDFANEPTTGVEDLIELKADHRIRGMVSHAQAFLWTDAIHLDRLRPS